MGVSVNYGNMPLEYQYLNQYHGFPNPLSGTPLGPRFGLPGPKYVPPMQQMPGPFRPAPPPGHGHYGPPPPGHYGPPPPPGPYDLHLLRVLNMDHLLRVLNMDPLHHSTPRKSSTLHHPLIILHHRRNPIHRNLLIHPNLSR